MLCHPGDTCTEHTLRQNFDWKGLFTTVHKLCKKFPTCQIAQTNNHKYGKLPPKQVEPNPWDTLCVDLIGPYTILWKGKNPLKLWCLTMIDPATGWFETSQMRNKRLQKFWILPRKLGLLVTHFHNKLCLILVPNLSMNIPRCVKTTISSKGKQLQLGILSSMQSSNESIKLLEISSAHLTCPTSLTTIHGLFFLFQPYFPSVQIIT